MGLLSFLSRSRLRTRVFTIAGIGAATATSVVVTDNQLSRRARERADRAHADSYPRFDFRMAVPRQDPKLGWIQPIGSKTPHQICTFARNRYTGEPVIVVPWEVSNEQAVAIATTCDPAFQRYITERGG